MNLDLLTIVAQIVNFLILAVVLKLFLWDSIVSTIEERRKDIAAEMQDASRKKREAEDKAAELDEMQRELDKKREDLIKQARGEAEKKKKELLEDYRKQADEQRERWLAALEHEKQSFQREMTQSAAKEIVNTCHRVLSGVADADLEERIVGRFVEKLENLDDQVSKKLAKQEDKANESVVVRSAFPLGDEMKDRLRETIGRLTGNDELSFETEKDISAGIELRLGGMAIAWNLKQYLDDMSASIDDVLKEKLQEGGRKEEHRSQEEKDVYAGEKSDRKSNGITASHDNK